MDHGKIHRKKSGYSFQEKRSGHVELYDVRITLTCLFS